MARRSRRQREASSRFWGGLFKLVLVLGLVGAIAYYAYAVGQKLATQDATALRSEIERLTVETADKAQKETDLKTALAKSEQELSDFKARYASVAPEALRDMLSQAEEKVRQGITPERLAFLISQAQEPKNCTSPETRRFLAKTTNYTGPNTWVRFNERITISGSGEAANAGREQWFDPALPVTLTVTPQGGKDQVISGVLPLKAALLFKDKEYHFTASAGTRGFIEVSGEWCDFRD